MIKPTESSDCLLAALAKRVPVENHEFIGRFIKAICVPDLQVVDSSDKPHVIAKRRDGLPALRIYYGYTTGFTSEAEATRASGASTVCRPSSRKGTWYVEHPTNRVRLDGERTRNIQRKAGFCSCGMQLSLTGSCSTCD
ncbi:hypothetical protein SAMN04488581_0059 [Mycolicibacterium neoaurum]|uniref:hypothetical protein n=1 Tax=Mycolicibacterium neoaurum TaxID=1795 RepID=UPI00055D53F3|nr:hypothetical protein [Mycolicibacterium neoaurum]SDC08175.1 hypothetical protein SAMN04488581_0059 [Mycolicibacterium neoaurum]